jgi:hypothetical protein
VISTIRLSKIKQRCVTRYEFKVPNDGLGHLPATERKWTQEKEKRRAIYQAARVLIPSAGAVAGLPTSNDLSSLGGRADPGLSLVGGFCFLF